MYQFVNEMELDDWVRSHPTDAPGVIAELVAKLVATTAPRPKERRFHHPDSTGQPGPDGVLDVEDGVLPFIPTGLSFWELGTGNKPRAKAQKDYANLTEAVPEDIRRHATFVFVTPLSSVKSFPYTWKKTGQADWISKKLSERFWGDVRVIDGTKLTDWLSQYPGVGLWLYARIFQKDFTSVESLEQRWEVVRRCGEPPPLSPDVFLADREIACGKLKTLFDGEALQVNLSTHYPAQVGDFVSAFLATLPEDRKSEVLGRTLIVNDADSWARICGSRERMFLIAGKGIDLSDDTAHHLVQKARNRGHSIIFGAPPGGRPDPTRVNMPSPRVYQLGEALKKSGYREERARTLAQRSGGNLGSLLRCLQNLALTPEWAQTSEASDLAIVALLGSWDESNPADIEAVERASGKEYGEWIEGIRKASFLPGTPLAKRGSIWKFVPRYEGWYALGPRIFSDQLDRIVELCVEVLTEHDPKFDLDTNRRFAAAAFGKSRKYSDELRRGLADCLALMGTHSAGLSSVQESEIASRTSLAIKRILGSATWVQWAGVDDLCPLLAEASPRDFLAGVEHALGMKPGPFDRLFCEESSSFPAQSWMTGLLWALETLAWDPKLLSRVIACLGELDARDPGGQIGNRPGRSLHTILLPWLPQTTAPVRRRVASVKNLIAKSPKSGWKLVLGLLPTEHSMSDLTRRPTWWEIIPIDFDDHVTNSDYWDQVLEYSGLAVEFALKHPESLPELFDHLGNLHPTSRESLLHFFESDDLSEISGELKNALWRRLVHQVSRNRRYADASWAMPSDLVNRLEHIADRIIPETEEIRLQRLFDEQDADLLDGEGDFMARLQALERKRAEAIHEFSLKNGFESVIQFVQRSESPSKVGIAIGTNPPPAADDMVLPSLLTTNDAKLAAFAQGYLHGRFTSSGWKWFDGLGIANWNLDQISKALYLLPFEPETWSRSRRFLGEEENLYWKATPVNPYQRGSDLPVATKKLLEVDRPAEALSCIHILISEKIPFNPQIAVDTLRALGSPGTGRGGMELHYLQEIFAYLQSSEEVSSADLVQLEWMYLPLFEHHLNRTPRTLWQSLADSPETFCEILKLVYFPDNEPGPRPPLTDQEKRLAENAYTLLRTWSRPPGTQQDDSFDGSALAAWCARVEELCTQSGHLGAAQIKIGEVLRHVPADPDGLWIHRSAAEILERSTSAHMREGFTTGLYNSRGVHWVDPEGKQEKDLARHYSALAEKVELEGYIQLAQSLHDLAESYLRDAERLRSMDDRFN